VKESGEARLKGWTVWIDRDGDNTLDAGEGLLSDSNGNWKFKDLAAGTYVVRIVQQSGYMRTTPTGAGTYTITLSAGQSATGKLFGEKKIA
jgi:hypothetical protein